MLDDATDPKQPGWYLLRLGKQLARDAPRFDRLERYWRGDPPLPHGNKKMREAYRRLQKMSRTAFGSLIVETVLERMKITAFRSGSAGTDDSDRTAWSWWQANNLDADSGLVHRAAVIMSRAYVTVGKSDDGRPIVTAEDPRQVTHISDPVNRRKVVAALKTWWDDIEDVQKAVLYLKDYVYYFRTISNVNRDTAAKTLWTAQSWELDLTDEDYPEGRGKNPIPDGTIPVVPFINRPNLAGDGLGEFEDVLDVLDRINNIVLDRLVIIAMQAYRQRWATGVDSEDEQGNPQNIFDPGADLLWTVPDDKAKFGEFSPTDVSPIIKAVESDVQYLGAITRTPPHYLLAAIVNASGDALATAETGLVSKLLERTTEFGESWERVYRLVGQIVGQPVPDDAEVVWKDAQYRTLTELASAAVQFASAGVPWRTRMALIQFTPAQIERMVAERAADALLANTLASLSVNEGGELGSRGVLFNQQPSDSDAMPAPADARADSPIPAARG